MEPRPPAPSPSGPGSGAPAPGLTFAGSGEREVALARAFWNSVSLQPPLESSLGPRASQQQQQQQQPRKDSAGLARRSRLFGPPLFGPPAQTSATSRVVEAGTQGDPEMVRVDEEKARYLQKAKQREEILALLRKQREKRIMREAVSRPYKPKTKVEESEVKVLESDVEDQESVKALI